jgi:hypothetical protein
VRGFFVFESTMKNPNKLTFGFLKLWIAFVAAMLFAVPASALTNVRYSQPSESPLAISPLKTGVTAISFARVARVKTFNEWLAEAAQGTPSVDTRGVSADINRYAFLGVSGAVTVTGYYTGAYSLRTGNSFTLSVPAADGTTAGVGFASIPSDATGVVFRTSGDVYFDAAISHTDMTANYANFPKILAVSDSMKLGR